MRSEKEWLSPRDLQEWLDLGKTKVFEILASGQLPSYKIGRIRRIRKADVENWLESQRYRPGE
jgi:excisionase family DNA binding protein